MIVKDYSPLGKKWEFMNQLMNTLKVWGRTGYLCSFKVPPPQNTG